MKGSLAFLTSLEVEALISRLSFFKASGKRFLKNGKHSDLSFIFPKHKM